MSQAEELLNSLDESGISLQLADSSAEPHFVVDEDRYITVPDELKRIAVQYDHDIETVTFDCPRYWDEIDMSEMEIYINYLRSDKETGAYPVTNVVIDADDSTIMHFDWTISRNVTEVSGQIAFIVCIKKIDDDYNAVNHWNSEICKSCFVSEGLEIDDEIFDEIMPDIVEAWAAEVYAVRDNLIEMRDAGEFDGATFIPYVSEDCDLSWTNNRGRENPPTVNVRGISPTIEIADIQGGHRVILTDVDGMTYFDVKDTIIDESEAISILLNNLFWVGDIEPDTGPVLWFDTAQETTA